VIGAEAEETAVALKITTETDCLLCEVPAEAERIVNKVKIILQMVVSMTHYRG
jgi:hypothetical protein